MDCTDQAAWYCYKGNLNMELKYVQEVPSALNGTQLIHKSIKHKLAHYEAFLLNVHVQQVNIIEIDSHNNPKETITKL